MKLAPLRITFSMGTFPAVIKESLRLLGVEVIEQLPVPVIGAICSYCLGGGFELAMGCDLRIASKTAVFHFPEMILGVFSSSGGPVCLCRLVSPVFAKEMLLTAKKSGRMRLCIMVCSMQLLKIASWSRKQFG